MQEDIFILVVDDEERVLKEFVPLLTEEGFKVSKAKSWQEAQGHLKSQKFHIVIADVNLPDIGYKEMIKNIKKENKYSYIITTADYSDIETATRSLKEGAQDYMSKPFDPRDTIVNIRMIVEKHKLKVDNIQLLETIKALALALDARDHYTHGHSQQVTDYALAIAERMNLQEEEIEIIRDAGLLHDIGKIGISDAILLKPGKLTEEEYNKIKEHPGIGKKILAPVSSLSNKIPLIYHHHERYDGNGYPERLKAEAIPIGARILAVADTYQAMTSDRPYRKALSKQVAVDELNRNKGTQFDPKIVEVFMEVVDKF